MKYKLFTRTKTFWNALQKDIENAQKSIYIEMYIFINDTQQTEDIINLLINKAKLWIKISIVLDAFWSRDLEKKINLKMQSAWIEILYFSEWLRRNHRKIIIIDKYIAFFGWANIHGSSRKWFDMQVRIRGERSIYTLLTSFAYTYKMCGGKNDDILYHQKRWFFKNIRSHVIGILPGHRNYSLIHYYKEKIISAEKSIKITTPYFIPPRRLIALLDDAQRRGVKIDIILPQSTDISSLDKINRYYMDKLIQLWISFYMMNHMNHAKVLIIDDYEGLIGSQNFDVLSFGHNREIWVFFTEKNIVKDLIEVFDQWKKKSTPYKESTTKLPIKDRLFSRLFGLIFYFM